MKRPLLLAIIIALVLIPLGMWWFSPEQVLKRRTEHLMDVMTISDGTGRPLRQAKVFSMNGLMADQVTISSREIPDANGTFDKQEMESAFSWICQNAKESKMRIVSFGDIEVHDESAKVEVMVDAGMDLSGTRSVSGYYFLTIDWIKKGDGWRYEKIVAKKK